MTRQDYMEGKVTHTEFYLSVAKSAGISLKDSPILPRVKAALANGDAHLNTIPLQTWDLMAAWARPAITRALKEHGDPDAGDYVYSGRLIEELEELVEEAERGDERREISMNHDEPTYENQLFHARRLLAEKGPEALNNPHAMIGRICGCGDCFCCAALEVLEEVTNND